MKTLARVLAVLVAAFALAACETLQNHDMPPPDIGNGQSAPR